MRAAALSFPWQIIKETIVLTHAISFSSKKKKPSKTFKSNLQLVLKRNSWLLKFYYLPKLSATV